MNSCAFILLGGTGDLARNKLFPALYALFAKGKFDNSIIIVAANTPITIDQLLNEVKKKINPADEQNWGTFAQQCSYVQVDFKQEKDFVALHEAVRAAEKEHGLTGNRLVYCATAPFFYCAITNALANSGLVKRHNNHASAWQRIVYEKPFGHNLDSAHEINACIEKNFEESQVYRIDHYLTKELVGNIALVRFTNIVFEPLWNNRFIDAVEIIFDETIGVEGRGGFYDKYGAIADVMQNHMMQIMALIGMESPEKLTGEHIRTQRAKVLSNVRVGDAVLGQYQGYTHEQGVAPDSRTETFAQVLVYIDNPRWAGVPFYLRTGKHLTKKETAIYIKFKQVDCLLTHACPSEPNSLTIEISPNPLFALTLNTKKPGKLDEVMPVQMHFAHTAFGQQMPDAYETLLEEVMRGEESVSVRFDEIEYAWKVVDAIRARKPPLYVYQKGSQGPVQAQELFENKYGRKV